MIIIYIPTKLGIFESKLKKIGDKFPVSSRVYVNDGTLTDAKEKLSKQPLFSDKYFVRLDASGVPMKDILTLAEMDNITVFNCKGKDSKKLVELFEENNFKFKILNEYRASKEDIMDFMKTNYSSFGMETIEYLVNISKLNTNTLDEYISSVRLLEDKSLGNVKKYIQKPLKATLSDLPLAILDPSYKVSRIDCKKLLYNYKFGIDFIRSHLVKAFTDYIYIYQEFSSGNLTYSNISTWLSVNKKIKSSEFRIKQVLDMFDNVTFERLYKMRLYLIELPKDNLILNVEILKLFEG